MTAMGIPDNPTALADQSYAMCSNTLGWLQELARAGAVTAGPTQNLLNLMAFIRDNYGPAETTGLVAVAVYHLAGLTP